VGGGTVATHGSPDLQEPTTKQSSAVCIIGVNKIAPNFVTLVATYIYMSFSFLNVNVSLILNTTRGLLTCLSVCQLQYWKILC